MSLEIMKTSVLVLPFLINLVMRLVYVGIKKKWEITLGDGYWGWVLLSCGYGVFGYWAFDVVAYDNDIEIMILSLFFLVMSVGTAIFSFVERIIYDEEGFYTGISFLKKEKYLYRDILSYRMGEKGYMLNVDTEFLEWRKLKEVERFMQYAVEQSQKVRNKEVADCLTDEMEDSLDENSAVMRRYLAQTKISQVVLVLGIVIFLCIAVVDVNENNAGYVEGKITEWYCKGKTWCFHVEGLEKELKIVGRRSEFIKNKINARRLPNEPMQIYYKTRGKHATYLQVYYLQDSRGNVYVTFEETNAYDDWEEWTMCAVWVIIGGFQMWDQKRMKDVLMNPQDYSEKLQNRAKKIIKQHKI